MENVMQRMWLVHEEVKAKGASSVLLKLTSSPLTVPLMIANTAMVEEL